MKQLYMILYNIDSAMHCTYQETNPDVLAAIERVKIRRLTSSRESINSDFRSVHSEINKSFNTLTNKK